MGEHAVRPGAGTRHGRRADGRRPGAVRPGPGPSVGGNALPGGPERTPCAVIVPRGPRAPATPRRKAVP